MKIRNIAVWLHRYVGLSMTVFLVIAGLTGSLLVFHDELDGVFNRNVYFVEPSNEPRLDMLVLRERLLLKLPKGTVVDNVSLHQVAGKAASLYVRPPPDHEAMDDQYFLDPATGEILGSRRWGDLTQGMTNFMPFVYIMHDNLALGEVGNILFGIVALLWTVDCFVGAYLTFPVRSPKKDKRSHEAAVSPRPELWRIWLVSWGRAWLVKTTKMFSFIFTWHRASGLWVWAMLLIFAWSGVALSLYPVYHSVTETVLESPSESIYDRLPHLDNPRHVPSMSFSGARSYGRQLIEEEARRQGFAILREDRLRYHPESGHFQYRVRSDRDITRRYPQTSVWFDGETGKLLGFDFPDTHTAVLVTNWLYALHWASWAGGGLAYRIFVFVLGFFVTAISVSGVWIWWVKQNKSRVRRNRERQGDDSYSPVRAQNSPTR